MEGFSDSFIISTSTRIRILRKRHEMWLLILGKQWRLDQMLSAVQASHQKMGWTVAKVDIKSQEAYELAVQG